VSPLIAEPILGSIESIGRCLRDTIDLEDGITPTRMKVLPKLESANVDDPALAGDL
jgi:hypothetical protein